MKNNIRAAISGVYGYVPEDVLTNADLEQMVDTSDEWITTRTGIKERRILKAPNKGSAFLGTEAVKGLLEKTNTPPKAIDLIICATITPELPYPATANIIAHAVGAVNAFSYDLQAACSGFLYALVTGAQFIETGKYKNVIIVGADKMSSIVDYTNRNTCVLFGDGAGAALLTPSQDQHGLVDSILYTDGSGESLLCQQAGGSRKPASHATIDAREHYIYQDGAAVFKRAVTDMADVTVEIIQKNGLEEIDFLVPHQANMRILDAMARRIGLPKEKVMVTLEKFGNTTGATIPLCLWQYEPQLKKGDKLIIATCGAGFTWGAAYLTWAYDGHA